jgi:hypothetical protein
MRDHRRLRAFDLAGRGADAEREAELEIGLLIPKACKLGCGLG